jgi:hypothetical protein
MSNNLQGFEFESNETVDSLNRFVSNESTITLAVLYLSIFIIGLLTNSMVIFVFALEKGFYQYSNYLFINLSISDVLILLFCVPIAITDLLYPDDWQFGSFYCEHYFNSNLIILLESKQVFFSLR